MRSERDLHMAFEAWLKKQGILYLHGRMDKRATINTGWPDFSCFQNGKTAFVEAKWGKGKLSPEQAECIEKLVAAGFRVSISRTLEEACSHIQSVFGLNEPQQPIAAQNGANLDRDKDMPVACSVCGKSHLEGYCDGGKALTGPEMWWTYSRSLACNVVVARNQEGHLGAIRIAKQGDLERLRKLPEGTE